MFSTLIAQLLVFQNDASPAVIIDPNRNLNSWLVIAGLVIIFFCLLTVFLPNIKDFITKPQEVNLSRLGVSMKVSILTVFVLMGFVLSLSSFALQWRGYVRQADESAEKIAELNGAIKQLENRIKEEQEQESRSRRFNMSILLRPQLEAPEMLNKSEWTCTYWLDKSGEPSNPIPARIDLARGGTHLRVFLNDITADTRLYRVELKRGNQFWNAEGLSPLTEGIWEAQPLPGASHEH